MLHWTLKSWVGLILAAFTLIAMTVVPWRAVLLQLGIVFLTTIPLDFLIKYWKKKRWVLPDDATISAFLIAGILDIGTPWYVLVFAGAVAMIGKHLIRWQGRQIFNPANSGILLATIIFAVPQTWWMMSISSVFTWHGLSLPFLFVGILFTIYYHHLDLFASYVIPYLLLAGLFHVLGMASFFSTLSVLNLLFLFIMLPEPKTSPGFHLERGIYGIFASIMTFVYRMFVPFVAESLALATANVLVPFLNVWKTRRIAGEGWKLFRKGNGKVDQVHADTK